LQAGRLHHIGADVHITYAEVEKRRALLKHLKEQGCKFFREGKEHTVY
jgi:hypothetical protein